MPEISAQEMKFTLLHGNWYDADSNFRKRVVQNIPENTLRGKYLAVTLEKAYLNIELKQKFGKEVRRFTLLEVVFHNIWGYRISNLRTVLVDSDSYQHSPMSYADYLVPTQQELLPDGQDSFQPPAHEIESDCKTRGWLWFDPLIGELFPHRVIIQVNIFSPGQISGSVKDNETLEFAVAEYKMRPI